LNFWLVRFVIAVVLWPLAGLLVQAGELRRDFMPSPALGENLNFVVSVPDGYEASRARYPVLYLLHGAGGDAGEWTSAIILSATA
jgi:poly(3-hydroxybutyrate) depolymerase